VHARKRGVESFENMSREGEKYEYGKKGKKYRKVKKEKNMSMRKRKRREIEKRSGKKDMRGMNQKKKIIKVQGKISRC
jgi:hypothetical protein